MARAAEAARRDTAAARCHFEERRKREERRAQDDADESESDNDDEDPWQEQDDLEELLAEIEADADEAEAADKAANDKGWKAWAQGALDQEGARQAHSWTKGPQAWVPIAATTDEGLHSVDPVDLLNAELARCEKLWCNKALPPAEQRSMLLPPQNRRALERISPLRLRSAGKASAKRKMTV